MSSTVRDTSQFQNEGEHSLDLSISIKRPNQMHIMWQVAHRVASGIVLNLTKATG